MYEPLRIGSDSGCSPETKIERKQILEKYLNCEFVSLNSSTGISDFKGNFPFRQKHARLCQPPFCHSDFSSDPQQCYSHCPDVNLEQAANVCSRTLPVIKTIRLCDLELLQDSAEKYSENLKIIILVRDPRGIFNSRRQVMTHLNHEELLNNIKWTCRHNIKNLKDMKTESWLNKTNSIRIYRFEDIALNPAEMAENIFNFCGLNISDSILNWISDNTRQNSGGVYSIHKNSTNVAFKWRHELKKNEILDIQKDQICGQFFELFGYKIMKENEIENLTETSFISEFKLN